MNSHCFTSTRMSQKRRYQHEILLRFCDLQHFLSGWCAGVTHGELTFGLLLALIVDTVQQQSHSWSSSSPPSEHVAQIFSLTQTHRLHQQFFFLNALNQLQEMAISLAMCSIVIDQSYVTIVWNFAIFYHWFCSPAAPLLAFLWFFTISKSDILIWTQWNCKSLLILINGTYAHKFVLTTSLVCKRTLCLPTKSLQWAQVHTSTLRPNVAF